jgi:hypothetical protein
MTLDPETNIFQNSNSKMCLWLPYFPHHNTVFVEKKDQLQPFRPVTVSFKRRPIVLAPYIPHHNTVVISSKKPADLPTADHMDEKQHFMQQLENGGFKQELEQKGEQLQAFKNDIVKSTKSNLLLVKAE